MLKNISHNNQKKIALINDFTGFGRCSIAVELPIISTLKVQCCPLPTSIFSNHTGFDSYFLMIILTGWKDMWRSGKNWIYHLTEYAPDFLVQPDRFLLLRIL